MPATRSKLKTRCPKRRRALIRLVLSIKSPSSAINTGANSSSFNSKCSAANRLAKVRILKDGEAASIKYFTNALGQQVFKSEPKSDQLLPDQSELGTGFINWLKTNFGWLYAQAQTDASLGSAYMYADGQLPGWAVLGEHDNGSASGTGRTEYIWLPTEDGGAVPVGMFRNSKFFAIHSDHLGTPRLMTDSLNKPVWQWPYSAFGNNKPTGVLKPTTSATGAFTNQPVLLATQTPAAVLDLRFPGQMAYEETGLFYNYFRNYLSGQGRYTQADPIGLGGGLNRFGYANQNALAYTDPTGEFGIPGAIAGGIIGAASGGFGAAATGGSVTTGAILGGIGGALVGGLGPVIGPNIAGQVLSRVGSAVLGNVLGQGQSIGNPGFQGFNVGSILGSGIGGALGGLIAPASYGTAFAGPFAGQIVRRMIAGIPSAGISGTSSLVGNRLGAEQTCAR